jgi:redox-sensitive bicupin YhaK (pirin superfamily)
VIKLIRNAERYHFENEWLSTYWHFSFDHYHDPANISFGPLRVFNDDVVQPGGGFPQHGHREMEIVTYVIEGQLEHRDDLGNAGLITPGEIQRMSAGTGVRHSEYNASKEKPLHLVQLWILPAAKSLQPSWEQQRFSLDDRAGKLLPIAIPAARLDGSGAGAGQRPNGVVRIHQDATIYTALLRPGDSAAHTLAAGRRAYLFLIAGELQVNGETLRAGDQARITGERAVKFVGPAGRPGSSAAADFLLLDLP